MRKQNRALLTISAIGIAALSIFFAVLITRSVEDDRRELWKEAGKATLQVLTVAVLGAVLKLLADHYRDERERLAQDARFRQDKYDRLVEATNALRRVPILLDADKSVETFDEQLRQVVEAGLKLRMIKHQIWSSKEVQDPPFPDHRELTYLFESLYHYTDCLVAEFVRTKQPLLVAQRRAEDADLALDARARAAEQVRLWVPAPMMVDDMRVPHNLEEHRTRREQVEKDLKEALLKEGEIAEPKGPWSWLRYEETEGLALGRITRATLDHRHSGRRSLRAWLHDLVRRRGSGRPKIDPARERDANSPSHGDTGPGTCATSLTSRTPSRTDEQSTKPPRTCAEPDQRGTGQLSADASRH